MATNDVPTSAILGHIMVSRTVVERRHFGAPNHMQNTLSGEYGKEYLPRKSSVTIPAPFVPYTTHLQTL